MASGSVGQPRRRARRRSSWADRAYSRRVPLAGRSQVNGRCSGTRGFAPVGCSAWLGGASISPEMPERTRSQQLLLDHVGLSYPRNVEDRESIREVRLRQLI